MVSGGQPSIPKGKSPQCSLVPLHIWRILGFQDWSSGYWVSSGACAVWAPRGGIRAWQGWGGAVGGNGNNHPPCYPSSTFCESMAKASGGEISHPNPFCFYSHNISCRKQYFKNLVSSGIRSFYYWEKEKPLVSKIIMATITMIGPRVTCVLKHVRSATGCNKTIISTWLSKIHNNIYQGRGKLTWSSRSL